MLKSTFADKKFSPRLHNAVMDSILNSERNTKRPFLQLQQGYKATLSVVTCLVILFGGGYYTLTEINKDQPMNQPLVSGQFNESLLKVDQVLGNERTVYQPVSMNTASEAAGFDFKLPQYLPLVETETPVTLTKWFDDDKKISLDIVYVPDDGQEGKLQLNISNFQNIATSVINSKQYDKQVTLDNNKEAYLTINPNVALLSWIDEGIEYDMSYYSSSDDKQDQIIKIANKMH